MDKKLIVAGMVGVAIGLIAGGILATREAMKREDSRSSDDLLYRYSSALRREQDEEKKRKREAAIAMAVRNATQAKPGETAAA